MQDFANQYEELMSNGRFPHGSTLVPFRTCCTMSAAHHCFSDRRCGFAICILAGILNNVTAHTYVNVKIAIS